MTRIRVWLSSLLLVSGVLATAAGAQDPGVTRAGLDSLRENIGFRVRVKDTSSPDWHVGTLKSVSDETLILGGRGETRIATRNLVEAQRSKGHARFNPTVVGFAVGLVVGGGGGVARGNEQPSPHEPN